MRPGSFAKLPDTLAVFPLVGMLLLPHGRLPLNIFEPRYLAMTQDTLGAERLIGMIQPSDPVDASKNPPLYNVGCAGRITGFAETKDNCFLITLTGLCRFAVCEELDLVQGYRRVRPDCSAHAGDMRMPDPAVVPRGRLLPPLKAYLAAHDIEVDRRAIEKVSSDQLVTSLAMACPFAPDEKQARLEAPHLADRAELMISLLAMAALDGGNTSDMVN